MNKLIGAMLNNLQLMRTRGFYLWLIIVFLMPVAYLVDYHITELLSYEIQDQLIFWFMYGLIVLVPLSSLEATALSFSTKWNSFQRATSIPPIVHMVSKYLCFTIISTLGFGIFLIFPFIPGGNITENVMFLVLGQLTTAVYYPLLYALNPKKENAGNIVLMVTILVAFIGGSVGITWLAQQGFAMWAIYLIIAAIYVVSIFIAHGFEKVNRGKAM